ncbi:MAG: hypothetical protein K0S38_1065 [Candidatus Paceibacter sp.]|jgi:uncharacterized protein YggU (UPF0235/DUF167 family)|nr:hypothetical protein [Candidatus Paceibacter sp.]
MYIKIRATPKAKVEKFVQKSKDHFEISVKEIAERNLANKRIVELVALHFKVPTGKVRIINGHHSPSKILSVDID